MIRLILVLILNPIDTHDPARACTHAHARPQAHAPCMLLQQPLRDHFVQKVIDNGICC